MKKIFEQPQFEVKDYDSFFYELAYAPRQVRFWDFYLDKYSWGIMYNDEIICACCGGILMIEDVLRCCPRDVEPIHVYDYWVDFTDYIRD